MAFQLFGWVLSSMIKSAIKGPVAACMTAICGMNGVERQVIQRPPLLSPGEIFYDLTGSFTFITLALFSLQQNAAPAHRQVQQPELPPVLDVQERWRRLRTCSPPLLAPAASRDLNGQHVGGTPGNIFIHPCPEREERPPIQRRAG